VCAKEARREGRRSFYFVGRGAGPPSMFASFFFFFDASSRKKNNYPPGKTKVQNLLLRKRFSLCREWNNAKTNIYEKTVSTGKKRKFKIYY
jgi:hypothetical protein